MEKKKYYELISLIRRKVYTESCIRHYSSNTVRFTNLKKNFIEKLRKFPFETYINVNGKDIK